MCKYTKKTHQFNGRLSYKYRLGFSDFQLRGFRPENIKVKFRMIWWLSFFLGYKPTDLPIGAIRHPFKNEVFEIGADLNGFFLWKDKSTQYVEYITIC